MKLFGKMVLLCTLITSLTASAQEDTWEHYFSSAYIGYGGTYGDSIWFRSAGGIIKVNSNTQETQRLNRLNSGMSHQFVLDYADDLDGVRWFCTRYKLSALDQNEWTVYDTENSGLPNNYGIRRVVVSPEGLKIFITISGIVTFDGTTWTTFNTDNSPFTNNNLFFQDATPGGLVYFTSASLLYAYSGGSIFPVNQVNDIVSPGSTINLVCDQNGVAYMSSTEGLLRLENGDLEVYNTDNSILPSNSVNDFSFDDQNGLWLRSGNQVFRFSNGDFEPIASVSGFITGINPVSEDQAYITSSTEGILFYNNGTTTAIPMPAYTPYFLSIVHIDPLGGLWIDNTGVGLEYYDGTSWQTISIEGAGFPTNYTFDMTLDQDGNPWFGFIDGDVHTLQNGEWVRYFNDQFGLNFGVTMRSITPWQDKMVLAHTNGLIVLENGEHTLLDCTTDPELCSPSIREVATDQDNNLWVLSKPGNINLLKYDGTDWESIEVFTVEPFGFISSSGFYAAPTGEVYVGTLDEGFAQYLDGSLTYYTMENSGLPTNTVQCFMQGQNGALWIGTNEGLIKWEDDEWTSFTLENLGIEGFGVSDIAIDSEGVLWLTVRGVGLAAFDGIDNWAIWTLDNSDIVSEEIFDVEIAPDGSKWISGQWDAANFMEGSALSVLENFGGDTKIILYPNPSSGLFKIQTTSTEQIARVELIDLQGKVLKTWSSDKGIYDIGNFGVGVYILKIHQNGTVNTARILRQ